MIRRRTALLGSGALLGLAPGGAPGAANAADKPPIRIGACWPLSGFQRPNGEMYRCAVEMAVEDINNAGGLDGSPLQIVGDDDQGLADQAVLLYRRHAGDGVAVHIGPISGTTFEPIVPLAAALKLPTVNFTALKPGMPRRPYTLKIHPSDDQMVPEGVTQFRAKFPQVKKVVITGDAREASGAAGMTEFNKACAAQGLTLADTVSFDTRTTDYSPVAIKIKDIAPDAVFVSSFGPNTLGLLKELDVQGVTVPVLANALIWAANFVQTVTAGADRIYTVGFNTNAPAPDLPGHDEFTRRYIERAKRTTTLPDPVNVSNATLGYDVITMIAGVVKDRKLDGTMDTAKLRAEITDGLNAVTTFQGFNTIKMLPNGESYIHSRLLEVDVPNKVWRYATVPG